VTAPRPFSAHEIGDLVRAGKVVGLGEIRMFAQRDIVICRCVRCNVESTCPHAELTIRADEIAAFVLKHQHTEKAS
jgi:Trk K+ transport system NAD-binding subunit